MALGSLAPRTVVGKYIIPENTGSASCRALLLSVWRHVRWFGGLEDEISNASAEIPTLGPGWTAPGFAERPPAGAQLCAFCLPWVRKHLILPISGLTEGNITPFIQCTYQGGLAASGAWELWGAGCPGTLPEPPCCVI